VAHIEQTQWGCNRCGKPTLHSRKVEPLNHVLHLLLTIFCCGWWLPIWILLILVHNPRRDPWRCSVCGQQAGVLTPEQQRSLVIQKAQERAVKAEQRQATKEVRSQQRRELFAAMASQARSAFQQIKRVPGQIDVGLRLMAGEGNTILYRFLEIAAAAVILGLTAGAIYLAALVIQRCW